MNYHLIIQRIEALFNYLLADRQPTELIKAMRYACLGGKHLRALLCYALNYDIAVKKLPDLSYLKNTSFPETKFHPVDAIALAIELVHSYSLVHDDLPAMDDDAIRRGKPSVHIAFNEYTAILVGDSLQSLAFEVLSLANLNQNQLIKAVSLLSSAIGSSGMAGGQMLDMDSKNLKTAKAIQKMYQLKTGMVFEATILLPYFLYFDYEKQNIKDSRDYKYLKKIGSDLGLFFQIQDDLLETKESKIGKPNDSDIRNEKNTLAQFLTVSELDKIKTDLAQRIEKNCSQISFEIKNLKSLIGQISQRDY